MGDITRESIPRREQVVAVLAADADTIATMVARLHATIHTLLAEVDRLTGENDVLRTEIANITASKREQP